MTCDAAAALYSRTDGGTGCQLHVLVHVPNEWQPVGVLLAVLVLVALGAIVVGQMRSR